MKSKLVTLILCCAISQSYAQMDSLKMDIDFRTKGELDNGYTTLFPEKRKPETVVLNRARIGLGYYYDKLETYISFQDIRTWGEVATGNASNQFFILSEAWAKYKLAPNFDIKVGRQVLAYDSERLIGGVDWSEQGRRFEAIKGVWKINKQNTLEIVSTLNNDHQKSNDSTYKSIYGIGDGGETSKSLQILHYQFKDNNKFQISGILLNNILQNPSGLFYDMLTVGTNAKKYFDNFGLFGSFYYQAGKNTIGKSKSAYQFSANVDIIFNKRFNTIFGTEWLSGTSYKAPKTDNNSFSPLYGTNHAFNGFMDYFFAGNYFNSYGLNDYYVKTQTILCNTTSLLAHIHLFTTNQLVGLNSFGKEYSKYLGTELDLVLRHKINKSIGLEFGQCFMFGDKTLEIVKKVANPKEMQSFTYLALKVTPQFKIK